jgi:arylsulfatase A-like enzyme
MRRTGPILTAAFLILGACGPPSSEAPFHNIVLITIDTLRADHVGAYGYGRPTTPFLDALAERGVLFESAYSSSPVTAPSHTSLFTSLSPTRHGVVSNGTPMPLGHFTTLAESFTGLGYSTGSFVSARFVKEIVRGFQHVDVSPRRAHHGYRRAEETLSAALTWLETLGPETPTFLWVHLYDVHQRGAKGPNRNFLARLRDGQSPDFEQRLLETTGRKRISSRQLNAINGYDSQLAYADDQLEQFYDRFLELRSDDPTLWIVTSDHGEGLGSHFYLGHDRHLYGEQLRVPLIVHTTPDRWKPARVTGMVRLVDVYPTLLDLVQAGEAATQQAFEGASFAHLLRSPGRDSSVRYHYAERHRSATARAAEFGGEMLAVQSLDEKYIYRETLPDEYYVLATDPYELDNLADQGLPEAERLRDWLLNHRNQLTESAPQEQEVLPEHIESLKALGYID